MRDLRVQLDWSQERLARELEVSAKTVSRWENGSPPKAVLLYLNEIQNKKPLLRKATLQEG